MIRFGKRLNKYPISIFRLKEDVKYYRFCCEVKDQEIDEMSKELEYKNKVSSDMTRTCGAYQIVPKDEYDRMKRDAELNADKVQIYERAMDAQVEEIKRQKECVKLACKMSDELRAKLSHAEKLNESFTYDKETVDRFDPKTPSELADYVQFTLDCGGKTSFAGACLALMKRERINSRSPYYNSCFDPYANGDNGR